MPRQSKLEESTGSVADRAERGRAARKAVPRSTHGALPDTSGRRDPIAVLEDQARTRVPELVPIRYGRMSASPFAFFRGAAAIMAMDLAATPVSGIRVQLCGDAHMANFGVYNAPDRRLVFDLNDFDETLPGPWEWDLKRLVASLAVAGRESGFDEASTSDLVRTCVRGYRSAMSTFAEMTTLRVWYSRLEVEQLVEGLRARISAQRMKQLQRSTAKSAGRDNLQAFSRLTTVDAAGRPCFASHPPLIVPITELVTEYGVEWVDSEAQRMLAEYRSTLDDDRRRLVAEYRYADLARKVVGVGSVGTRAWVALLLGRDDHDPLVLQFKEAQASVLEPYVGASEFRSAGHRVVAGQRLMQAASDIFLGWYTGKGIDGVTRDFYGRQLRDGKGSVDIPAMDADTMRTYGEMCAWTLARAHARSGDRVAIAAYVGAGRVLDDSLAEFAHAYADRNALDHAALVTAIADGRVTAEVGV